ncbi:unnamed protein product, partial [Ixodes hexagonus]
VPWLSSRGSGHLCFCRLCQSYSYTAPVAAYYAAPVYSRAVAVVPAVTSIHHGAGVSHVSYVSSYRSQHPVATPVARYATVHWSLLVATVHTPSRWSLRFTPTLPRRFAPSTRLSPPMATATVSAPSTTLFPPTATATVSASPAFT